ncbi:MAG TPA: tetratricopeptide repeat protein [Stellaceae bacterium]|nr:tetratricopeptide repeat protein [Stellaceae bacterium]
MTRLAGGAAVALLLTVGVAPVALAQEDAQAVLLDKANYWRLKDRPDLAAEALNKLLEIDPNNAEGLFQYGELSVQMNKPADAQRYLAKLQQVAPDSPHIADLQAAIRAGKLGPSDLTEARRLAQAGQLNEAVQKYREVFRGPPPSSYGIEYYMTLAGTPDGWDEARQGMEKLAQQSPNDAQVKLSLAELYTYREPTRMQGIAMLAQLSKNPVVSAAAVQAWKQALTWLGGSPAAKPAFQQYLAQYPQDADIQQLLADLKNQPAGGSEAQSQAYLDLKKGNLAGAERQFQSDLHANPNDPQAIAGLGLLRLRQQRFAEARDLLGRAMRAAPDQQKALGPAYNSAVFWSRVEDAKRAAAARNYAAARAILVPLLAHPSADQWGAEMVLGDVETKSGQYAAAEATYRQVLRWRPGNPDATLGLANALRAQNKSAELAQLTSRMSPGERAAFEKSSSGGGEAEKLRNEAKAASANGDNATAIAKFQAAIAADPRSPWIRLDYARFLAGQGNTAQAFAAVDPAASGNTPTSVLVAAMFDSQQDRWVQALDRINSIPVNLRTEDIRNFRDRIYVRGTIERAKALAASGNVTEGRNLLVQLYQDPSVTTDEKRQAPFELTKAPYNDMATAQQITREAYMRGGPGSIKAGADYASLLLLEGGHDQEAAQIMAQIASSGRVTDNNREDLTPVNITIAIRQADKLRDRGDYAGAWDQISRYLQDNPDDVNLLCSAGRIYASSGRSKEAMEYFDKAFQQDSGNVDVIRQVVAGAILAHQYAQAQSYLDKGMEADSQNAWLFFMQAQIDQARGNNGAAIQALLKARSLNQQAAGPGTAPAGTSAPTPLAPAPSSAPPNPFRSSQLDLRAPSAAKLAAAAGEGGEPRTAQPGGALL